MKRLIRSICCLIFLSNTALVFADQNEVLVTGRKGESGWLQGESSHFIIVSNTSEEDIQQLLIHLERLDYILRLYTKVPPSALSETKIKIYYPQNDQGLSYISTENLLAVGYYANCREGSNGFGVRLNSSQLTAADLKKSRKPNENFTYLFEAYAKHFLLKNTELQSPKWFVSGFAHYFSTIRFTEDRLVVGRAPEGIKNYLNFLSNNRSYKLEYRDLLTKDIYSQGKLDPILILEFEAKSWLMSHYILSSTDNVLKMQHYSNLVNGGADPVETFESIFGIKMEKLKGELSKYRVANAEALTVLLESLPTDKVTIDHLPTPSESYVLIDALMNTCPTKEQLLEAGRQLQALAEKYPSNSSIQFLLNKNGLLRGEKVSSPDAFLAQLKANENSYEANRYLAKYYVATAKQEKDRELKNKNISQAQAYIRAAISLEPNNPRAYFDLYASGLLQLSGPSSETFNAAVKSWQLGQDVTEYGRSVAMVFAHVGKTKDAEALLHRLTYGTGDADSKQWAEKWLTHITNQGDKNAYYDEMLRLVEQPSINKEWTIATDKIMQAVVDGAQNEPIERFMRTAIYEEQVYLGGKEGVKRYIEELNRLWGSKDQQTGLSQ